MIRVARISVVASAMFVFAHGAFAQGADARIARRVTSNEHVRSLLEHPARLNIERVPLEAALNALTRASGVPLAFSPARMPRTVRTSCTCWDVGLREALDILLAGTSLQYEEMAGQIALFPAPPRLEPGMQPGTQSLYASPARLTKSIIDRGLAGQRPTQRGSISGKVIDRATSRPIALASVRIVALQVGTLTSNDGRFVIPEVPSGSHVLTVEIVGYTSISREVIVRPGASTEANFELAERALELDELVVSVSAEGARRAQLGTDISVLDADQAVNGAAISSLSDLLHSRVPGVTVTLPSGQTGAGSLIRIRGATSLTQDNTPLIYVDGVRVSNNTEAGPVSFDFGNLGSQRISRLNDINPQNIADIQVIKGPSASALYGSEAAAGVIVIRTKKGLVGATRITFGTEQGIVEDVAQYRDNYYPIPASTGITDVDDARISQWRPVANPVTGEIFVRNNPLLNPHTRPFRLGHSQSYTMAAQGGGELSQFFASARYEQEDGTLPNNGLKRVNLRANLDISPSSKVSLSFNSGYVDSRIKVPHNDHSAFGMVTNGEAGFPLYSRGVKPDGSEGDCLATVLFGESESICDIREGNLSANFAELASLDNGERLARFLASINMNWRPAPWLSSRLAIGADNANTRNWQLVPLNADRPFGDRSKGYITDARASERTYSVDVATTLTASLGSRVSSTTTVGGQLFRNEFEQISCIGDGGFASTTATACDAAVTSFGGSDVIESAEIGGFLLQQVSIDDNIFINGSLRADDNSGFGENQGAIWSPGANVSVVFSKMSFWPWPEINDFRFRAAWGRAAQAPSAYAYQRTFRPVRLERDGQLLTGLSPLAPGNPNLTAERNEEIELGFDVSLLNDRLSGRFTYFDQQTTDAIVSRPVAKSTGFEANQWVNLGRLENKGVEVGLNAKVLEHDDLIWEADFSASTQAPIVTSLGDLLPSNVFRVGYAPGYLSGAVVESAERDAQGSIMPGSVVMKTPDIEGTDRVYQGRPEPSNEQKLAMTLTLFDDIRLFTLFARAGGHHKFDGTTAYLTPFIRSQNVSRLWAMRQVELTPAEQAAVEIGGSTDNFVFTRKGDFIRWRELSAEYQLPEWLLARIPGGVSAGRIAVGGANLFAWTDYMGLDPESREDGGEDSFQQSVFFTQPAGRRFFVRLLFDM